MADVQGPGSCLPAPHKLRVLKALWLASWSQQPRRPASSMACIRGRRPARPPTPIHPGRGLRGGVRTGSPASLATSIASLPGVRRGGPHGWPGRTVPEEGLRSRPAQSTHPGPGPPLQVGVGLWEGGEEALSEQARGWKTRSGGAGAGPGPGSRGGCAWGGPRGWASASYARRGPHSGPRVGSRGPLSGLAP